MTVTDDRPRNGKPVLGQNPPAQQEELGPAPHPPAPADTSSEAAAAPAETRLQRLQRELDEARQEARIRRELNEVEADPAFVQRRTDAEKSEDQQVERDIRGRRRAERRKAGYAEVRAERRRRWQAWWDARAERVRQKFEDPARAIGSIQRTWSACAAVMITIITGGVVYMADTVKKGVVGESGTVLAYAIEPMASAMLVISLAMQTMARRRGATPSRWFIALDIVLCAASIAFVTVPWGMRYGWDTGTTLVHLIVPLLVTLAVIAWHLSATAVADMLLRAKHDPLLVERLEMLRTDVATGDLEPSPSIRGVEKHLRHKLGGIGQADARRVARSFLGK